MRISLEGINLIKKFEGLRLKAYRDSVNIWTIGYGHTKDVKEGMEITEAEAERLLREDLDLFERGVSDSLKVNVSQFQFDALVCLAFNIGLGNLKKSSVLKWTNLKEFKTASESFLLWNKAGGNVLPGLTRRRLAEKELYLKELPDSNPRPPEVVK